MSRTQKITRRGAVALALLLLTPTGVAPDLDAADWTPKSPPSIYDPNAGPNAQRRTDHIADVCTTDAQLDCVESIAAKLNGAWVPGQSTSDMDGPSRLWTIPGVTNLNGTTKVSVTHKINFTGNLFLQTQISAQPVNGVSGDREASSLPRGVPFRATVRTSWVLPTHVSGKSTETTIKVEKLSTSGASRVTLEGIPTMNMIVLDRASLTDPNGKGAYEQRSLQMTVSDGRYYPIKKDCIEKPTIMTSENGYGHPIPSFKDGNLDLKVESPHFLSDGVTKHIGVYEALIPLDTATCLWGSSIKDASALVVEVIETDGSSKTATTSINVTADAVVIKASGFSFSTPTIRVRSTVTPPAATTPMATSPAAKPSKPTGVRTSTGKGSVTVSFTRVNGLTYSAVAVKGKSTKAVKCSLGTTRVTCKGTKLAKGKWKITVTPANDTVKGTTYSKTVSVK